MQMASHAETSQKISESPRPKKRVCLPFHLHLGTAHVAAHLLDEKLRASKRFHQVYVPSTKVSWYLLIQVFSSFKRLWSSSSCLRGQSLATAMNPRGLGMAMKISALKSGAAAAYWGYLPASEDLVLHGMVLAPTSSVWKPSAAVPQRS